MREKIFQQKSTRIFGFVCCRKIFCHYSPDREKKMKNRSIDQISTSSMCILCFASQYLTVDRKIFQKKKRKNFSKTFFFILPPTCIIFGSIGNIWGRYIFFMPIRIQKQESSSPMDSIYGKPSFFFL